MSTSLRRSEGAVPLVYGHRGAPNLQPENTLDSFALALSQGADGVELDVRLCADGLVVFHDADLKRLLGRPERICELPYRVLANLDVGGGVPRLEQAIELVLRRGGLLNIELKSDENPAQSDLLARAVCNCLDGHNDEGRSQIILSSFSATVVTQLRTALPAWHVAQLVGIPDHRPTARNLGNALHPHHSLINDTTMSEWSRDRPVINTWTVNRADDAVRLAKLGVDGIITDDVPGILAALTRNTEV